MIKGSSSSEREGGTLSTATHIHGPFVSEPARHGRYCTDKVYGIELLMRHGLEWSTVREEPYGNVLSVRIQYLQYILYIT